MKQEINEKLDNINFGVSEKDYNYEIITEIGNFINYVKLGATKHDKIKILMMCYMSKPTLEELRTWGVEDILAYMIETDEYIKEDLVHIEKCLNDIYNNEIDESVKNILKEIN